MKKVSSLSPNSWYNVSYQPNKKHGYSGPAKFVRSGDYPDILTFILPEDLHTLKGDEEFVNYSYFAAKDVMSEYQGEAPMDYFELLAEVKRLKDVIEQLTNEYDNDIQSLQQELEANRH